MALPEVITASKSIFIEKLHQSSKRTENPYLIREFRLDVERNDYLVNYAGHAIYFRPEFELGTASMGTNHPWLGIRFESVENDGIVIMPGERIDVTYSRVYISHAAIPGGRATLIFMRDMDFYISREGGDILSSLTPANFIAQGPIAVGIAATLLFDSNVYLRAPNILGIANLGPNPIYIGDNTVTLANGFPILSNQQVFLDNGIPFGGTGASRYYAICAVAQVAPADTRLLHVMSVCNLRFR